MLEPFLFECSICWIECMFDGKREKSDRGKKWCSEITALERVRENVFIDKNQI